MLKLNLNLSKKSNRYTLKFSNINFEEKLFKVLGKGRKERLVPFGGIAESALNRMLKVLKQYRISREFIFTTTTGKPLKPFAVQQRIKIYLREAGLPTDITPHDLRHSCATHFYENGANLRIIQEFLGHSAISSTQKYVHVSSKYLKKVHQLSHPRG